MVASSGDWAKGFRMGLIVTTVFVAAALLLALVDVLGERHRRRSADGVAGHRPRDRWSHAH